MTTKAPRPRTKPTTPKRSAAKPAPKKPAPKLPAALQKNAKAMADAAKQRLQRAAQDAFDRARAAIGEADRHLYDLGLALVDLERDGYAETLGFESFNDLCARGLGLSRSTVSRLTRAVKSLPRERYVALRPDRVDALLELAEATEADDTQEILDGARVALWDGGPVLDVAKAQNAALREAAREVRARRDEAAGREKPRRGRTTTRGERRVASEASSSLSSAGSHAKLRAKATKPGAAARFELVDLTEAEAHKALKALGVKVAPSRED